MPIRGWLDESISPPIVPDGSRRYFRSRAEETPTESLWMRDFDKMMTRAATLRIYCEPDLHTIAREVLVPGNQQVDGRDDPDDDLAAAFWEILNQFPSDMDEDFIDDNTGSNEQSDAPDDQQLQA